MGPLWVQAKHMQEQSTQLISKLLNTQLWNKTITSHLIIINIQSHDILIHERL